MKTIAPVAKWACPQCGGLAGYGRSDCLDAECQRHREARVARDAAPHEPTAMVYSHRSNQKHTHHTSRGNRERNHWFSVYKCPVCGRTASHKRQPIMCRGRV